MFVFNLKINSKKLLKLFLIILAIIAIILFIISVFNIFKTIYTNDDLNNTVNKTVTVNDYIAESEVSEISSENYTNILKQIHDDIDSYIGRKISFTGYIYRIDALEDNQFVLARNMIINSASQSVIVGFLSEYENIDSFKELTWVHVTGTIQKGYLDGDIPILKVIDIKETSKPKDEYVYPPDDTYIPTSILH